MDELQKLYDVLVREGKYSKSFDEFQSKWSKDQAYKDKVYGVVTRDGLYSKDKDSFLRKYTASQPIVKKKDSSESNIPQPQQTSTTASPSADGSLVTPPPIKKQKLIPIAEYQRGLKKEEEEGYLSNLGTSIMSGINDVNKMITSIPETIYNAFSIPQNAIAYATGLDISTNADKFKNKVGIKNPALDYYKKEGKRLEKETANFNQKRYESSSIYENVQKGNYQDAFELLGSGIVRSAPTSIAIMAGGATLTPAELATASTAAFYDQNLEQIQEENPDNSDIENNIKALGMSAAESVFSSIGKGQIGAVYKDIIRKEGIETGQKVFKDGLVQMYKGALQKYGVPVGLLGEGIEESATQITQNMISGKPAFDGAADAFILGGGSGVMFTAPISLKNAKDRIKNRIIEVDDKKKINTILEGGDESFINVFDVSKDSKINEKQLNIASLEKSRDLLVKDLDNDIKKGNITEEQAKQSLYIFDKTKQITGQLRDVDVDEKSKVEIANLLKERESLSEKINGKDEALSILEKQRISEINEKIKETILKSKEVEPIAVPEVELEKELETLKKEEDAVQKQTTDESVLRTEQPQLELQGVGEGNAQPEGVAQESIITEKPEEVAKSSFYFSRDNKDSQPEAIDSEEQDDIDSMIEKIVDKGVKNGFSAEKIRDRVYTYLRQNKILLGMFEQNGVKDYVNGKVEGFLQNDFTSFRTRNNKSRNKVNTEEVVPIEITGTTPTDVATTEETFFEPMSEEDLKGYEEAVKQGDIDESLISELDKESMDEAYRQRDAELELAKTTTPGFGDKLMFLHENLGRIRPSDFDSYGDANQREGNKGFFIKYLSNKAIPLDTRLGELSDLFGSELTPDDAIEYILDRESNPEKYKRSKEKIRKLNNAAKIMFSPEKAYEVYMGLRNDAKSMSALDALAGKVLSDEQVKIIKNHLKQKYGEANITTDRGLQRANEASKRVEADNAIKTLQESKEYIEADDIQKEKLVRATRKELGLKEKSAPSVNRLFGKLKDIAKVTMTEKAGLVKQIKDTAKGARESVKAFKLASQQLTKDVKELKASGKITATQLKTILNKFSKVNMLNEKSVSNFVDYMSNVFADAQYAKNISEIKKLQRQAKSRNHTSMSNIVNRFTSINPELIPLDRLQDYVKALDFLNTRTPSYINMNEIFSEITSYEKVEEFDAIKTMDALEKKYDEIKINSLKNVEQYVSLIRDINSFKRKAYQLLQEDVITQEEYDNLINRVGNDQAAVEKKYEKEITQIKNDLINDIKKKRPKRNADFSNEENNLINKYLTLNNSDLSSLSPEDLFILNDILENISNGEIDYYRFSDIISRAFTNDGVNQLAKQIEDSKFDMSSEKGRQKLSEQESAFWEGLLGMGRIKAGALQKFVISTFNRAIASYESFIKNGYNEFLSFKKKYNIKDNEMHKIGMLTTYLQEYMAQFDSKNKGIDGIGKRDWFKEILNNEAMKDNYSSGKPSVLKMIGLGSSEIEIIQEIWNKLPKDKNGEVNPKDVYESYIANDGKFFTKNEKAFFDDVMKYKESTITPKQKAANELSGKSFKEVPFHMLRVRLDSGKNQIQPSVSSDNGNVRIKANTGKERTNEKVGAVMTNFEKLFISNIEQTGRDYFLSGALKDINNILSGVKKIVNKDKIPLLNTISYGLSDALKFEFDRVVNNVIFRNLISARAAMTLLDPIRTGVELISTLISYPIRAKDFSGYYSLFNEQGIMKKLLEFTDSPMLLRKNISKAIDINDGSIKPQSKLDKATNYLSGLPERTMMVTSWMPSFKSEFKNITDTEFDIDKFNKNEAYREKYSKAIMESAAVADAQTEKIVGTTTKAGQRREVRLAPKFLANIFGAKGTVSKNTPAGQILGFFSNYPFRESTEFINGFREAAEVLKKEGALSSLSQLQKPLGIALNLASYGFFSSLSYALSLMLLGDDEEEKRGEKILDDLITLDGFLDELKSNAISLAGSQYAAGGKAMLQIAATIGIMSTDKEEDKDKIKKLLKDSVFVNPLPVEQATKFGGKDKALGAIGMYIPQFVIAADRFTETIGSVEDIKLIYNKVEKDGVEKLTEDEKLKIVALNTLFNATQLMLNLRGTSIPGYNKLKTYMKGIKEDAKEGISKEELKKSDPEMYNMIYGAD
jgi:uncharacterized protein Veg